jgi:hypothetical protein
MREDLSQLKKRFPKTAKEMEDSPGKKESPTGTLLVIFEDGLIPAKRQIKLPIPLLGLDTFTTIAFPFYDSDDFNRPVPLQISVNNQILGQTDLICELQAMAVKALKEQMLGMVTRQLIRATAKAVATKAAYDSGGTGLAIAAGVATWVTENADRRSWLTLPSSVQIARLDLDAGAYSLQCSLGGMGSQVTVDTEIENRKMTLVFITRAGQSFYHAQATYGRR